MKKSIILFTVLLFLGCGTGIDQSEDPGVLRVILKSSNSDTTINILNRKLEPDTASVMRVKIFEARAFIDSNYIVLYPTLDAFKDDGEYYNLLEQNIKGYSAHKIYETHVPPDIYNKIQFGFVAEKLEIGGFDIPLNLPKESSRLFDLEIDFPVNEHDTTELNIIVKPFKSLNRYQDQFLFNREIDTVFINKY